MGRINWMPSVEVESHAGVREVSVYSRHLMNRRVFLKGQIDDEMANDVVAQLLYLQDVSDEPIQIFINSGGGEVSAGLYIYDVIQSLKVPVYMYCTGMAASMAAIIFAGGQEKRRFILPHSRVMIHEPLIAGGVGGSASSIHNISESILEIRSITNEILAKHTGKSIKEINKATAYDNYMNAEVAVEFGMCDEVVTGLDCPKL